VTCPPIVFLIFNRPEQTARTFAAIRAARPAELLVVADGPRPDRAGERELCSRTRAIIDGVDWPCKVLRNFAETNMGCGKRVSSALDWAFEEVEEALILEDDCLPDPSFFPYCAELLERYRTDERIMMISGNNFQNGAKRTPDSYYFSRFPHCWGWATWRRAWRHYDFAIQEWQQRRNVDLVKKLARHPVLERYWQECFDDVAVGKVDTWDYQWMYCLWMQNGLAIAPNVNMVTNIGFDGAATHTLAVDERYLVPSCAMPFPLRHPTKVISCKKADEFEKIYLHRLSRFPMLNRVYPRLRVLIGLLRPSLERAGLWKYLRALAFRVRP
jgi:hypothetical protein